MLDCKMYWISTVVAIAINAKYSKKPITLQKLIPGLLEY